MPFYSRRRQVAVRERLEHLMDSEPVEGDEVGVLALGLALQTVTAEAGRLLLVGLGVPVPPFSVLSDLPHRPERLSFELHAHHRRGESLALALDQGDLIQ